MARTKAASTPAETGRFRRRREEFLEAAEDLILQNGVAGLSLSRVCERLDLAASAIFYYFPNKEELAAACMLRAIERVEADIASAARAGGSPKARIAAVIAACVDTERRVVLKELKPAVHFNDVRALDSTAVNTRFSQMFRMLRHTCLPRDALDVGRVERNARTHVLLANMLWARSWLWRHEPEQYARAGRQLGDILASGLLRRRAKPSSTPTLGAWPVRAADAPLSREDFLAAATQLINAEGYVGASVERISAALNVTKGAFYHLIPNKDDLVEACFHRSIDAVLATFTAAERLGMGAGPTIHAAVTALVRGQLSGHGPPLLHSFALTAVPPAIRARVTRRFDRLALRIASLVCDGVADGSVRAVDANVAAQAIMSLMNAAAELPLWAPQITGDTADELFVRPFFTGLASA